MRLERINKRFRKMGEVMLKRRWIFIALVMAVVIVAFAGLPRVKMDPTAEGWFNKNDPVQIATDKFEETFGNNEFVAVLVSAEDIFQPEILNVIRDIGNELKEKLPYVADINPVMSLTELEFTRGTEAGLEIVNIVPDTIPTEPAEIERIRKLAFTKESFVNKLFSEDSKQTWIILRLKPFPDDWQNEKMSAKPSSFAMMPPEVQVGATATQIVGQDKYKSDTFSLTAAGTPVFTYEHMLFFEPETGKRVGLALLAALILLVIFLRSFRGVIIPLFTMIAGILVPFGVMGYLGIKLDMMGVPLPVYLGIGLSVGYSVHIYNSFKRHFRATGKRKESVLYAVEHTGWPIFFAALTTVVAMVSMAFVNIVTIRWLGLTCASVVGVVYLFVMILLPILISFGKDKEPKESSASEYFSKTDNRLAGLGNWVMRKSLPIVVISLLLCIVLIFGFTRVAVDVDMTRIIGLKVPFVKRLDEMGKSKIGSAYSYNATITFPKWDAIKDPEVLTKFDKLVEQVNAFELTKKTSSILDIIKDLNQVMNEDNPSYYRIPDSQAAVAQLLLLYENSGGAEANQWINYNEPEMDEDIDDGWDIEREDASEAVADVDILAEYNSMLRLQVEMPSFSSKEVEHEHGQIERMVKEYFPDATVGFTGSAFQLYKMTKYLVNGQILSLGIALLAITILMVIVFRSVKAGLIGMIPNIMPVIAAGGIMGICDFPLDFMTMTIMPMLLGIAVDDTIHFINHVKYSFEQKREYSAAVLDAFRNVGKALCMTTFILVLTFGMFMTSVVKMYWHIGLLSGLGLLAALLADYLIAPVLMRWTNPFGKEE